MKTTTFSMSFASEPAYPDLIKAVKRAMEEHRPEIILIEDA